MRIDYGPGLDEIRDSVRNGSIVRFSNIRGEEVRGLVLDARVESKIGRVALVLEEIGTGLVFFARYRVGGKWSCGDIVSWQLKRNDIEELRRSA